MKQSELKISISVKSYDEYRLLHKIRIHSLYIAFFKLDESLSNSKMSITVGEETDKRFNEEKGQRVSGSFPESTDEMQMLQIINETILR